LYQFIVLFVLGVIIPLSKANVMVKPDGIGLRATFDMGPHPASRTFDPTKQTPGLRYALDWIWQAPFLPILVMFAICFLVFLVMRRMRAMRNPALKQTKKWVFVISCIICGIAAILGLHGLLLPNGIRFLVTSGFFKSLGFHGIQIPASPLTGVREIPAITGVVIAALCLFTHYFTKTKLGQDCRSIGQDQHIAEVSGINVDRTRIIATIISTLLASWGMIIYLQNMGTVSTYTSQMQIGISSVAAILVGGASTSKASIKNALLGLVLFNAMSIVSPAIGRLFSGDEGVGEYTRSFIVYGAIGLALGLYIWRANKTGNNKDTLDEMLSDPQQPAIEEKSTSDSSAG
jgi:simple sugar transport system permease protein